VEQPEPKENQSPETETKEETTMDTSEPEGVLLGGVEIPGEEPCPCPCPCEEE